MNGAGSESSLHSGVIAFEHNVNLHSMQVGIRSHSLQQFSLCDLYFGSAILLTGAPNKGGVKKMR